MDKQHRQAISSALKGRKLTASHKLAIRLARIGQKHVQIADDHYRALHEEHVSNRKWGGLIAVAGLLIAATGASMIELADTDQGGVVEQTKQFNASLGRLSLIHDDLQTLRAKGNELAEKMRARSEKINSSSSGSGSDD